MKYREAHRGVPSNGIAIDAPADAEVKAVLDGKAVFVDTNLAGYGPLVILEHPGGLSTVYAGMARILVTPGAQVRRGEAIGKFASERSSAGSRLYFEVRRGAAAEDPIPFLPVEQDRAAGNIL